MQRDEQEWHEAVDEVCSFARVLAKGGMLESVDDAIYFFEKPWKWSDERNRWVAAGRPESFDFEADALAKLDALLEDETLESPSESEKK